MRILKLAELVLQALLSLTACWAECRQLLGMAARAGRAWLRRRRDTVPRIALAPPTSVPAPAAGAGCALPRGIGGRPIRLRALSPTLGCFVVRTVLHDAAPDASCPCRLSLLRAARRCARSRRRGQRPQHVDPSKSYLLPCGYIPSAASPRTLHRPPLRAGNVAGRRGGRGGVRGCGRGIARPQALSAL